jgi:hypothetical protein
MLKILLRVIILELNRECIRIGDGSILVVLKSIDGWIGSIGVFMKGLRKGL